jgi:hypothetical protein
MFTGTKKAKHNYIACFEELDVFELDVFSGMLD